MSLVCPRCALFSDAPGKAGAFATSGPRGASGGLGFASCAGHDVALVPAQAVARAAGDPLLGALLAARFAIVGARSFGASAATYDAIDRERGDACVAKVLRSDGPAADEYEARVRHEAEILSRLPPGVGVALRGVGVVEVRGRAIDPALPVPRAAFVVMDPAVGSSLTGLNASLDRARAGAIFSTLLAKLEAMHAMGVAHGDLKPDHVFVDAFEQVASLVDFGSAVADERMGPGCWPPHPSASPAYAAPEGQTTPSGDLFAAARTVRACLVPVVRAELDAFGGERARDGGLVATLARCLMADPDRRPRTASQALRMLAAG